MNSSRWWPGAIALIVMISAVVDKSDPGQLQEIGRYINTSASKQQAYNDVLLAAAPSLSR